MARAHSGALCGLSGSSWLAIYRPQLPHFGLAATSILPHSGTISAVGLGWDDCGERQRLVVGVSAMTARAANSMTSESISVATLFRSA
ncbi:MAG: hypothetical protein ACI89J_003044, partial [Hyphomicrobiaceae bacterium]